MDGDRDQLVRAACEARANSYAPYSQYAVGAALRTVDGSVFSGANVENSSFGLTVCAERIAFFRWCTESASADRATPVQIAVAAGPAAGEPTAGRPCGACLQVMQEFAPDLTIWIVEPEGVIERKLRDLLPDPFIPGGQIPGFAGD